MVFFGHFTFNRACLWGFLLILSMINLPGSEQLFFGTKNPVLSFFEDLKKSLSLSSLFGSSEDEKSPTMDRDPIGLAQYDGYGAERHTVTTEDGYILEVHRIYKFFEVGGKTTKPIVIVHHDFLFDSRVFLLLGPGKALAYVLADAGFDLWLCNARGNTYSRQHKEREPNTQEFWDFSYTEHGVYDLPAVIDYTLKVTGHSGVHYVGHSMGATNYLVMGAKRPDYLSKVKSFTALAPVSTTMKGRSKALLAIMNFYPTLAKSFELVGEYDIGSHNKWKTGAKNTICSDSWYKQKLCSSVIFALSGESPSFDQSILSEMFHHFPSGSSVKTFRHIGQNYYNGFREYDYGPEKNLEIYNSKEPPYFNISNINVPTQIFYGENDMIAGPESVKEICNTLQNVFRCDAVEDKTFGHIDFIGATDVPFIYERVALSLKEFERQSHVYQHSKKRQLSDYGQSIRSYRTAPFPDNEEHRKKKARPS